MCFLAVGLLGSRSDDQPFRYWCRVVLAGMAVGMSVMEGYDVGAIFSLFVGAFVIFLAVANRETSRGAQLLKGIIRLAVVGLFAAFLATHALNVLIGTQLKGVSGNEATQETKGEKWDWTTQWSMPKSELPRIIIPGLFGYRMDTPKDMEMFPEMFEGGNYWGRVGETPGWAEHHNEPEWARAHQGAYPRFSGGGEYAGILVVAIGLWAVFQSWRKQDPLFTRPQQLHMRFWTAAAFVSLLLATGRYAPFYQFFYMLPYMSTIRNPAKFMHTFHWCLLILFAYGVDGLSRRYLQSTLAASSAGLKEHIKTWWSKAAVFDRRWAGGSLVFVAASLIGWLIYASSKPDLEKHLMEVGFGDPSLAAQIASFSLKEVGWYILFLVVSVVLLLLILTGRFAGRRARLGTILVGAVLLLDLARADLPWIIYQDYKEKYATNPVIDFLRQRPYEHRVAALPGWISQAFRLPQELVQAEQQLDQLYRIEWAQHHFQYYNIQSLDIIQMPRTPIDMRAFEGALQFKGTQDSVFLVTRRWELTNTRYLLGPAQYLQLLNQGLDAGRNRFQIAMRFDIVPKPGVTHPTRLEEITASANTNGAYAVFDFTGALPRAKLYANWQVSIVDPAILGQLASKDFDPARSVFVSSPVSAPDSLVNTNQDPGTVEFTAYAPKHISLRAHSMAHTILLLNDKFDPAWRVTVDGKAQRLLRCNFIMRGVEVPKGDHTIEFTFEPSVTGLYVSLLAIGLGVVLTGFLAVSSRREAPSAPEAAAPATGPSRKT